MKYARWLAVMAVVLLTGCGGSAQHGGSGQESLSQREAREKRTEQAQEHTELLGGCLKVEESESAMINAIAATGKRGANRGAFEEAVLDIESLRTHLGELAGITTTEETIGLEESRFFLLRVGELLEAIETGSHKAARRALTGYEKGMVALPKHIKAACKS